MNVKNGVFRNLINMNGLNVDNKIKIYKKIYSYEQKYNKLKKQKVVNTIKIQIVDHCNLNCAGCDHFSPLAEEWYEDIENFKNDIKRITKITNGNIKEIILYGGEPLLHKKLIDFIKVIRIHMNLVEIKVATNGILLESFIKQHIDLILKYNVSFQITKYPINLNYSEILKKFNNVDISFSQIYECEMNDTLDIRNKLFNINLDKNMSGNKLLNFVNCLSIDISSLILYNGILSLCPPTAFINIFNKKFKTNILLCQDDYINIYDDIKIDDILSFCSKPHSFCKYCGKIQYGNNFKISNKDINEWVKI